MDVGDQSPLEAAAQAVFDLGQLLGRTVAGDDDLPHRLVQGVEGVEELFLRALLADQELDVIHQQHVHVAVLVAEAGHLVVPQRVDHLVGEFLAGHVADGHLRLALLDLMSDGLHQVGLAHADAAVQEERVVGLGRPLRHRARRRMRKLVARADDKPVKRVLGIQLRCSIPVESLLPRRTRCRYSRPEHGSADSSPLRRVAAALVLGGALLGIGHKLDVLELEAQVLDGLADQVAILLADVAEVGVGDTCTNSVGPCRMAEAGGFEPGFVGVPVDFLFQRIQYEHPRIGRGSSKIRHSKINPEAIVASNRDH